MPILGESFLSLHPSGSPLTSFDLVVIGDTAVPEPTTATLAAVAGAAGLLALRKKRAK